MRIIFDRSGDSKEFPLSELLNNLSRSFELHGADILRITRFGGLGTKVWALESILDGGGDVTVRYDDLKELSSSEDAYLDELACIHPKVIFGISDASFMFIQSHDKAAEISATRTFKSVEEITDQAFT